MEVKLLDRVREAIRMRHYSRRTEAYTHWIRRYIVFHGKRHPSVMGTAEISAFLTWLAVRQRVSASTQNQALSALLFLYKEILRIEIGPIDQPPRARTPVSLPVVLTREEVAAVLKGLQGTLWIIGMLLTWPLGGIAYGLAASRHRGLRWASGVSLAVVALFISVVIWGVPALIKATAQEAGALIGRLESVEAQPEQRTQLTAQLEALQREVETSRFREYDRVKRASALMRLLDVYARDGRLTPEECADWASKYESRALIDPEALEQQIRQIDVVPRTTTP